MAKKNGGMIFKNCYNEVANKDPNSPDLSGAGLYASYDEVIGAQLSTVDASLESSPNSQSGEGICGGPAPGEPNPARMDRPSEGAGRK